MAGKQRSLTNLEIMDIMENDSGPEYDTKEMAGGGNMFNDLGDEEELEESENEDDYSVNLAVKYEIDKEQNVLPGPGRRKQLKIS